MYLFGGNLYPILYDYTNYLESRLPLNSISLSAHGTSKKKKADGTNLNFSVHKHSRALVSWRRCGPKFKVKRRADERPHRHFLMVYRVNSIGFHNSFN